jgi:sugar porter (SP) family MFS transporter
MQLFDTFENYFNHVGTDKSQAPMLGLLNNAFAIGSIVSMFIVPWLTDTYGRKPSIIIGCLLMIVGGIITTASTSLGMLIGGRVILGFGNSLSQLASPMLLTEIIHPQHRAPVTAVYNCLWNLGSLISTFVGWGTSFVTNNWAWRSIALIQIFPSLCQLIFIWFIPESPRWMISKDRNEEALQVLAHWHANGNVQNPTVQFEYREIRETLRIETEAKKTSWLDFTKTKGNRWRLAIIVSIGLISQYSGNAVISNYMNLIYIGAGITDQNQKLAISSGKTVLDLSVSIGAAFMVDRVGRRPLFLTAICGMVFAFIMWTVFAGIYETNGKTQEGMGIAQIVFVWVFGIFYDIGFSGLLVAYTLEVLPYHLRAKGVFIMNITVQATLVLGGQTNPIALENLPHQWNFWIFYTVRSPHIASFSRKADPNSSYSFGILSRLSGCTSSLLRPRARPWRRLPRSSTVRVPSATLTSSRSRRRSTWSTSTPSLTRRTWPKACSRR